MHVVAENGEERICEMLLARAEVELSVEDQPRVCKAKGKTPLETAVENRHEKIVLMLLHRLEESIDSSIGPPMLATACRLGWDAVIVALARRNQMDASTPDYRGKPPLLDFEDRGASGV